FETSKLHYAAARSMLTIVSTNAFVYGKEAKQFQLCSESTDIMTPNQWHCLATVFCMNEDFVREQLASKLFKSLISHSLGLEFLAIFSLGGLCGANLKKKMTRMLLEVAEE